MGEPVALRLNLLTRVLSAIYLRIINDKDTSVLYITKLDNTKLKLLSVFRLIPTRATTTNYARFPFPFWESAHAA